MGVNNALPMIDRINAVYGVIVAVLSYAFGEHWWLFAAYLGLNILDFISGCYIKAMKKNKISSVKGTEGILKKFGYWMLILLAFGTSAIFNEIGEVIGVNMKISNLIGWFVLGALIVNEYRSILENLVESGIKIPTVLTKGLEVADKVLNQKDED